ncbi:MAG: hypothetical protein ACI4IF_00135 [Acutalibacteraceae bacterium]
MIGHKEKVKKRKSYYGFAKNYPGKLGSNKYVIGDSRAVKRREAVRTVIIIVLCCLLFALTFVVTTVGLNLSGM